MRELKFRVWDYYNRRFIDEPIDCVAILGMSAFPQEVNFGLAQFEIQQYSGEKDKFGKEIYEGDIIIFKEPFDTYWIPVEFKNGAFGFTFFGTFNWLNAKLIEVVGNIFENPELL